MLDFIWEEHLALKGNSGLLLGEEVWALETKYLNPIWLPRVLEDTSNSHHVGIT